jgi:hypothetical protein
LFLFFVVAICWASSSEEADLHGRRGGSFLSTTGSFALSSGSRAGNSERTTFLGDDDQDDSIDIEDIAIPPNFSEEEAHERVTKAFATKQSREGKARSTVLDASPEVPGHGASKASSHKGGDSEHDKKSEPDGLLKDADHSAEASQGTMKGGVDPLAHLNPKEWPACKTDAHGNARDLCQSWGSGKDLQISHYGDSNHWCHRTMLKATGGKFLKSDGSNMAVPEKVINRIKNVKGDEGISGGPTVPWDKSNTFIARRSGVTQVPQMNTHTSYFVCGCWHTVCNYGDVDVWKLSQAQRYKKFSETARCCSYRTIYGCYSDWTKKWSPQCKDEPPFVMLTVHE